MSSGSRPVDNGSPLTIYEPYTHQRQGKENLAFAIIVIIAGGIIIAGALALFKISIFKEMSLILAQGCVYSGSALVLVAVTFKIITYLRERNNQTAPSNSNINNPNMEDTEDQNNPSGLSSPQITLDQGSPPLILEDTEDQNNQCGIAHFCSNPTPCEEGTQIASPVNQGFLSAIEQYSNSQQMELHLLTTNTIPNETLNSLVNSWELLLGNSTIKEIKNTIRDALPKYKERFQNLNPEIGNALLISLFIVLEKKDPALRIISHERSSIDLFTPQNKALKWEQGNPRSDALIRILSPMLIPIQIHLNFSTNSIPRSYPLYSNVKELLSKNDEKFEQSQQIVKRSGIEYLHQDGGSYHPKRQRRFLELF